MKENDGDVALISKEEYGSPNTFCIKRTSYVNKHYRDVHRILLTMTAHTGNVLDVVFLQYYFEHGERQLQVKKHGNMKRDDMPYVRTQESTKILIKDTLAENLKPKEHYHKVLQGVGGVENLAAPGQNPRDQRQIKNFQNQYKSSLPSAKNKDDIAVVMDMFAQQAQDLENMFVNELETDPEVLVFIATRDQLRDMERCCTDPTHFCVVGVDATFNVGNFYLTMTSYRNLKLETKDGHHPVLLGPVLIHQRKLYQSYYELPAKMIKYNRNLQKILAFGTDGEKALSDAFTTVLPFATHLLCDIHLRDNCKSKLSQLNIPTQTSNQFLEDIFGQIHASEKTEGLS